MHSIGHFFNQGVLMIEERAENRRRSQPSMGIRLGPKVMFMYSFMGHKQVGGVREDKINAKRSHTMANRHGMNN
jgi:hypothetical protein